MDKCFIKEIHSDCWLQYRSAPEKNGQKQLCAKENGERKAGERAAAEQEMKTGEIEQQHQHQRVAIRRKLKVGTF